MSALSLLLLAGFLAFAGMTLLASRRALKIAFGILAALAIVQLVVDGFYWQLVPGYLLMAVAALVAFTGKSERPRWIARIGIAFLALAAIGPFAILPPIPHLLKPTGQYALGAHTYRWVDSSRDETWTPDPADKRNVIAQVWYPATPNQKGERASYIDGISQLPASVSLFPGFVMKTYGAIDTHAVLDAPVNADKPWPLVILSPGFGAPRAFYTGLAADLASRGFIVVALDHPYEGPVTQLADGRMAHAINDFTPGTPDGGAAYMNAKMAIRIADISFALDQLAASDLSPHIDPQRIYAIGHSFGGASAAAAMASDPRIKAAVNIDGTLYRSIDTQAPRPFLLIESDHAETSHAEIYETGARSAFNAYAGGWRYELKHANHFSFTDGLLFFAPPMRFVNSLVIGGGRGPEDTQRTTVDLIAAFLADPKSVETASGRQKDLSGGRVNP